MSDFEGLVRSAVRAELEALKSELVPRMSPGVDPYHSYTLEEAAERMKLSVYEVNRLRRMGLLRSRRTGKRVRILERDIQACYQMQDEIGM